MLINYHIKIMDQECMNRSMSIYLAKSASCLLDLVSSSFIWSTYTVHLNDHNGGEHIAYFCSDYLFWCMHTQHIYRVSLDFRPHFKASEANTGLAALSLRGLESRLIQGVLLSMIWYKDLDACFCHLLSSIINKRCSVFCCYLLFFVNLESTNIH